MAFTKEEILNVQSVTDGPSVEFPITPELLLTRPSGHWFGWSQDVAMGKEMKPGMDAHDFVIVSTQGGMRGPNGENIASGLHIGHWELGKIGEHAAKQFKLRGADPYYLPVADPCDGRTQGTPGMMVSLPYRNFAADTMSSLMNSHPTRKGIMGIATCDKGTPAMGMALARQHDLPTIYVPGGVSLPAKGGEHLGPAFTVNVNSGAAQGAQTMFAEGQLTLEQAEEIGCKACGTPGGGCQFLGTAATSQVVMEALGMSLPHSALTPSGQKIWLDMGERSADALLHMAQSGITTKNVLTDDAIHNAMVVHAAFGGSTNLLLHIPAIAHAAGLKRPKKEDWEEINRKTPRLVDILPNHKTGEYTTVHAFMAGGVPEVMLHLRDMGLLKLNVMTVTGKTLGENLAEWEKSERRQTLRDLLNNRDHIDPDKVIYPSAETAKKAGLTSTVTFPSGNLAPEGSVIKSTAIDPSLVGKDPRDPSKEGEPGVYHKIGKARIFTNEEDAMHAIKGTKPGIEKIKPGEVMVLIGLGPLGMGMPETFQVTRALKASKEGKHIPLLTDGRFSGVSTGACIGHIGPEALAGGPLGKLRDGDMIEIKIDTNKLTGDINFVGTSDNLMTPEAGRRFLETKRQPHPDLKPHKDLPNEVRTWAALQNACGGTWGGCVYDPEIIEKQLEKAANWDRASPQRAAARR